MIRFCRAEKSRDEVGTERDCSALGDTRLRKYCASHVGLIRSNTGTVPLERSRMHSERQLMSKIDAIEVSLYGCENRKEGGWYEGRNRF